VPPTNLADLVATKIDQLTRSVPDARKIDSSLAAVAG
jgi:hypothetical protein